MPSSDKYLTIGRFGKPYGLKGWVRLSSETDPASNILAYKPWVVREQNSYKELNVTGSMMHGDILLVHIAGFDNPEDAKALSGICVLTERQHLPTLNSDEFYWADLEGLEVFTTDDINIGRVDYLMEAGACDVMVIKGEKEYLIPFDRQNVVKQVDLKLGKITVDWDLDF